MSIPDKNSSLQEIFDFVVTKLREQGEPSLDPVSNACLYRGPNGRKCAAGWLLPDGEQAKEGVEAWNVPYFDGFSIRAQQLINALQDVHDGYGWKPWEKGWLEVATEYNLIYTPPGAQTPPHKEEVQ